MNPFSELHKAAIEKNPYGQLLPNASFVAADWRLAAPSEPTPESGGSAAGLLGRAAGVAELSEAVTKTLPAERDDFAAEGSGDAFNALSALEQLEEGVKRTRIALD